MLRPRLTLHLAQKTGQAKLGPDLSELARQRLDEIVADRRAEFSFEPESFDVIVVTDEFSHVDDPRPLLCQL